MSEINSKVEFLVTQCNALSKTAKALAARGVVSKEGGRYIVDGNGMKLCEIHKADLSPHATDVLVHLLVQLLNADRASDD